MSDGDAAPSPLPEQGAHVWRTLPEHFAHKSPLTDTAGIAWKGRDYTVSPFPEDRGELSATMREALRAVDAGQDTTREALVAALAGERVLVPIQAIATEEAVTASGLHADNASDMAMVSFRLADGQVALPLFTSVAALNAWSAEARPVPLQAERAAQAAVAEGCTMLVIDAGRQIPLTLSRSALWALAQGRAWTAPHRDPRVLGEVARLPQLIAEVTGADLAPGDEREVELRLTLVPGLNRAQLAAALERVSGFLATSDIVAERVSSLKLTLR